MITTEEYRVLFNAVSDAVDQLNQILKLLIEVQCNAEEIVIQKEESSKHTAE